MIFLGDFHGNWNGVLSQIQTYELSDVTIICVGDTGIGFKSPDDLDSWEREKLFEYGEWFKNRNIKFLTIRGNHCNPAWFPSQPHPNLELIGDYTIREIEGRKILFVGGSISIDRKFRIEGVDYWKDEQIVTGKVEKADIVVAHDCPLFLGFPPTAFPDCQEDIIRGRKILEWVAKEAAPKLWVYGHYHQSSNQKVNGTEYLLLNILEFRGK